VQRESLTEHDSADASCFKTLPPARFSIGRFSGLRVSHQVGAPR
jgi:hypothetical protein